MILFNFFPKPILKTEQEQATPSRAEINQENSQSISMKKIKMAKHAFNNFPVTILKVAQKFK